MTTAAVTTTVIKIGIVDDFLSVKSARIIYVVTYVVTLIHKSP